jgi:NAD(P)H dehydrogenase (quinone)
MYAATGITGRVGGVVARTLLDAGLSVRAAWKKRGSEVALAEMNDAD